MKGCVSFFSVLPYSVMAVLLVASARASHPACDLVPDPGPCRAFFRRFFWDKESATCKPFIYGGCGGAVPFRSVSQCEAAKCASKDVQPDIQSDSDALNFEWRWWPGMGKKRYAVSAPRVRTVNFTAHTRIT